MIYRTRTICIFSYACLRESVRSFWFWSLVPPLGPQVPFLFCDEDDGYDAGDDTALMTPMLSLTSHPMPPALPRLDATTTHDWLNPFAKPTPPTALGMFASPSSSFASAAFLSGGYVTEFM